jgi:hypothetical protein
LTLNCLGKCFSKGYIITEDVTLWECIIECWNGVLSAHKDLSFCSLLSFPLRPVMDIRKQNASIISDIFSNFFFGWYFNIHFGICQSLSYQCILSELHLYCPLNSVICGICSCLTISHFFCDPEGCIL